MKTLCLKCNRVLNNPDNCKRVACHPCGDLIQPATNSKKYAGRYLAESEINAMAECACNSYEFTCDWKSAYFAAKEYCEDEYGFTPNSSAIALAVNKAKLKWEGFRIQAQKAAL